MRRRREAGAPLYLGMYILQLILCSIPIAVFLCLIVIAASQAAWLAIAVLSGPLMFACFAGVVLLGKDEAELRIGRLQCSGKKHLPQSSEPLGQSHAGVASASLSHGTGDNGDDDILTKQIEHGNELIG